MTGAFVFERGERRIGSAAFGLRIDDQLLAELA